MGITRRRASALFAISATALSAALRTSSIS